MFAIFHKSKKIKNKNMFYEKIQQSFQLLRLFLMILGNEMDLVNREKISKSVNVCKKNTEQIKQPSIN